MVRQRGKKKKFSESEYMDDGKLLHDKFAEHMRDTYKIIKIDDILHMYHDGYYVAKEKEIKKVMRSVIPELTKTQFNETLHYLTLIAHVKKRNTEYISFENWLYNIKTHKLHEHDPNIITTNKIPLNIDMNAYSEVVDKTLERLTCNDKEVRQLLEEMIGYLFLPNNKYQKAFILFGEGSNGKSTFIKMLQALLGENNYSALSLQELSERFSKAELLNKMANLGDDIPKKFVDDSSILKKVITGEEIKAEEKGKKPFILKPYAKFIFACNEMVKIDDQSYGLYRRLIHVPFNASFSINDYDYDPSIEEKLQTEKSLQYLFKIAMEGLQRLEENKRFTEPKVVKQTEAEFKQFNNPIAEFLEQYDIVGEEVGIAYDSYYFWCAENNHKAESKKMFSKNVHTLAGLKTLPVWKKEKTVKIYKK